jgi:hypothetical protein
MCRSITLAAIFRRFIIDVPAYLIQQSSSAGQASSKRLDESFIRYLMGLPTVSAAAFQRGFGRCQNEAFKHPSATTRNRRDRTELNEFAWPARIYGTWRQGVLMMVSAAWIVSANPKPEC